MIPAGCKRTLVAAAVLALAALDGLAAPESHDHHAGHRMQEDAGGMVMNANDSVLPRDCGGISRDYEFEVRAGAGHASAAPGTAFGYSRHEFRVEPCSRVTVTLVNEDEVRHQWMVHGLPRYLYPEGMFHIEAAGGRSRTGTFIVPSDHATYLVHCDIAQHMEKGMKGQLRVGRGSGDLPGIPGVSSAPLRSAYLPGPGRSLLVLALLVGGGLGWLVLNRTRVG